jgi:flavin reductase (DIM6/NTAB) family NADH-FMN oxidoreductase RutF
MKTLDLATLSPMQVQQYLQHAVAPRPICFASTIDSNGLVNLSPFSFFNLFSSNPPVVIFSPARRVRDNTTKHTLENVLDVPEVCINMVNYAMVQQMSLSSCEYPKQVNEFEKAGFTPVASELIRPPRVAESPVQMECKVLEVKALGDGGGAGNLIICEVLRLHIAESVLNEAGMIDQHKMDLVARLGGNWYSRTNAPALFEVEKPNVQLGIGFDQLPEAIRYSKILSGNHLGQLANVSDLPNIDPTFDDPQLRQIFQYYSIQPDEMERELHTYAAQLLDKGEVEKAWQVLLAS